MKCVLRCPRVPSVGPVALKEFHRLVPILRVSGKIENVGVINKKVPKKVRSLREEGVCIFVKDITQKGWD